MAKSSKSYSYLSDAYSGIFHTMYTLAQVLIALPVGTGTVKQSFSQMKQIQSRLRNRLSNQIFHHLLKIAMEGPELWDEEYLNNFKATNRHSRL